MDKEEERSEHLVYGPHPKKAVLLQQEEGIPTIWVWVLAVFTICYVYVSLKLLYNKTALGNWTHQGKNFWSNLLFTLFVFKSPWKPAWQSFKVN